MVISIPDVVKGALMLVAVLLVEHGVRKHHARSQDFAKLNWFALHTNGGGV